MNLKSVKTKISTYKIFEHIIFLSDSEIVTHFSDLIYSNVISMHSNNIFFKSDLIFNESSRNSDSTISWNLLFQINYDSSSIHFDSNISNHWNSEYRKAILQFLKNWCQVFWSDFNKIHSAYMLIFFQNENDIKKLKQFSYHIFACDWVVMNKILNDFVNQDWIQSVSLNNLSSAVFLMFIVWKNDKSRIVVNFYCINVKLWSDAYSLSWQNIILSVFDDNMIFSSLNIIKKFFQVLIELLNHWKIIFVIFHQKHEQLMILTMSLFNNSEYFQHFMKDVLKSFLWIFFLVYIDNIIIYSAFLENHIKHFLLTIDIIYQTNLILLTEKCHFAYSSV